MHQAIVFTGNFHYLLSGETAAARLEQLTQVLANWRQAVASFDELVEARFLVDVDRSAA